MHRAILAVALTLATALAAPAVAKDTKDCPPGLAKKAVPCVPPGQAKKSYRDDLGHDDDFRWRRGDAVYGDYVLIPRAEWERLALRDYRDGSTYLEIDDQILRVLRDTLVVLEAVRIVDRVLN